MTYQSNTYSDEDMRDVLAEIEGFEDEIGEIMASAMGKAAGLRKKIKATKKRAKDDLSIPMGVLNPLLKVRKLDRQRQKVIDDVSEDLIEVFEDADRNFGLFADTPLAQAAVQAEQNTRSDVDDVTDREQQEGEAVLKKGRVH